ncbi:peptidoglycan DD-metalloendopeptidase family protein, partial [Xanthomonas citri pv. citri]|nr:peptidoglycan DD-metalloendopeptidase family protein [Xanthomonas citri pv. citri]
DCRQTSASDAQVATLSVMEPSPVMSVYQGTVISVGRDPLGYVLVIQHGNDFISQYSGLENIYVKKDSRVEAGEAIGSIIPDQP